MVPQAVVRSFVYPTGCRNIKHLNNYPPSADINAPFPQKWQIEKFVVIVVVGVAWCHPE